LYSANYKIFDLRMPQTSLLLLVLITTATWTHLSRTLTPHTCG